MSYICLITNSSHPKPFTSMWLTQVDKDYAHAHSQWHCLLPRCSIPPSPYIVYKLETAQIGV